MHIENSIASTPQKAAYPMLKPLAYTSTGSILAFILARVLNAPLELVLIILGLATLSTLPLLVRIIILLLQVDCKGDQRVRLLIKANIFFHLAPASYVTLHFFRAPTLQVNALFIIPIAIFFYSGRRTWKAMHEQFGSKLYKIFVKGNTAFLFNIPVLFILGLTVKESLGIETLNRMVTFYSAGHMAFLGFTSIMMEKEFKAIKKSIAS